MTKKILPLFVLITLAACLLSYKIGSAPVALAKARPNPQDASESAAPMTLPTAPGTWTVTGAGGSGQRVSISRPAGGTGVKHVATCIIGDYIVAPSASAAAGQVISLRDGLSGTGTLLASWGFYVLPGTSFNVSFCDLNVVGSPNTPMTPWNSMVTRSLLPGRGCRLWVTTHSKPAIHRGSIVLLPWNGAAVANSYAIMTRPRQPNHGVTISVADAELVAPE